ncbi:DNA-binding protein [Kitasatospora nipponensis]|uniref:DNA-binding protein n=1 Tax=Kitasatospora nipponensis TaxID=258049 RepID=A0ABN1W660_9ACTN
MTTLFGALVSQRGMSYRSFVKEYGRTGQLLFEETGDSTVRGASITEATFLRWKRGDSGRPRDPAPQILERMFNFPLPQLFAPLSGDQMAVIAPAPAFDESDLRMTARDAHAHASDAAAHVLPDLSLDQLEDDLVRLVRAHTNTPPHLVYVQAKELLGLATTMLDRTQILSQRGRLLLVAGQASALLGACAFDLGSFPNAVELLRAAALYGQVAEHGPLQAYAYGYLAILSYWSGNPTQAVRQVQRAQQFEGVGATGQARLAAIAARAYAHLGRVPDAQQAIQLSLLDRGTARDQLHDEIAGEFAFSPERVAMSNSATYLLIRDGAGAGASARRSLELIARNQDSTTPIVVAPQASTDLAMALLLREELDAAAETLQPVLRLPREWRGAALVDRITAVRRELVGPAFQGTPMASALAEEIEDYTAVAAPRVLGPATIRPAIDRAS